MKVIASGIPYFIEFHQKDRTNPTVILLHGFMGSGRSFRAVLPLLKSFCNPVTIDLLGHGKTGGAASPDRFAAARQIDDIRTLIKELSEKSAFLYGYSMGGRLALQYVLKHPETLRGLLLESATYGLQNQKKITQRLQVDEERAQAIEQDFTSFLEEWKTMPIFQNGISMPDEKLEPYYAVQAKQEPGQMAHSLRGFGTASMAAVKDQLKNLAMPVLLLAGQQDWKYTELAQQMHRELPNSTLSIIPNAGHRVHLEHPKALATKIKLFINKVK